MYVVGVIHGIQFDREGRIRNYIPDTLGKYGGKQTYRYKGVYCLVVSRFKKALFCKNSF